MDALRKQATKLREQVAKQQQAVLKQFTSHTPIQGSDTIVTDEAELQRHQQLERLYTTTRAGKHFQRDIVKGIEGIVSTGTKQLEFATKLGEDCRKYATESPSASGTLGKTAMQFGTARMQMEKEREGLNRILSTQIAEPLRAMVMGAPLEDARHLTQRYDRLRQDAEAQGQEVGKRQLRSKEVGFSTENSVKLQVAEAKMTDLTSAMAVLGKEAAAAMSAVEAQQQRLTLQRLIAMVEAERGYHLHVAEILDQLYNQMISERQHSEALPIQQSGSQIVDTYLAAPSKSSLGSLSHLRAGSQKSMYFLAEAVHPFVAEAARELSLNLGDYVVVRQVSATGWSEGECKGKAGWFPSTYVERRERGPVSKLVEAGSVF